jgi:hypothetical protein
VGHDPRAQRSPRSTGDAAGAALPPDRGGLDRRHFTAFASPWGTSFTRNLTPDKETGLGDWTVEEFIATMKTGRERGKGRPCCRRCRCRTSKALSDTDIRALFAYLQSLPPIKNRIAAAGRADDGKTVASSQIARKKAS